MLQCAYWYQQSISVTVSLLYSVGNKTYNYTTTTIYTIEDAGSRTLTHPLVMFRLKLHIHPVSWETGFSLFGWFELVWRVLCSSDRCWGKCNFVITMTFYTCKTAVARQYLVLWRRTSTGLPAAHQHLCTLPWSLGLGTTGTVDRKWFQMTAWLLEQGSQASKGILMECKLVWLHFSAPGAGSCLVVHVDGTNMGQVIISWFFSNFT